MESWGGERGLKFAGVLFIYVFFMPNNNVCSGKMTVKWKILILCVLGFQCALMKTLFSS
jgi:hypothetical protein